MLEIATVFKIDIMTHSYKHYVFRIGPCLEQPGISCRLPDIIWKKLNRRLLTLTKKQQKMTLGTKLDTELLAVTLVWYEYGQSN